MGSEGTGKFSDYSNNADGPEGAAKRGSNGEDPCNQQINTLLEEVERSQYYKIHKSLPAINSAIRVVFNKRLGVEINGEIVGYLSTEYNYLFTCIKSGSSYAGIITSIANSPLLRVQVQIYKE